MPAALTRCSLVIINKFGGLMFQQDFYRGKATTSNDYLRLAGTFHTLYAITSSLSPVPGSRFVSHVHVEVGRAHALVQRPAGT